MRHHANQLIIVLLLCAAAFGQGAVIGPGAVVGPGTVVAGGYSGATFVASTAQALGANGGTTSSINTTGANFIAACVTHLYTVSTPFSDNGSNSWTLVRSDTSSNFTQNDLYYVYSPTTSASHTFTTAGTGSKSGVSVLAFSNVASNPLDQQNGASINSNETSYGPGAITPTTNNELIIPCYSSFLSQANGLNGFSGFQEYNYSANNYSGASGYQLQGGAYTVSPIFTIAATASNSAASEASFISNTSAIPTCVNCAFNSAASTTSGGVNEPTDPTSFTANPGTGALLIVFGWHTNWTGSGTTTASDVTGLTWHRCSDGGTGAFVDIQSTSTGGMSCNYAFATNNGNYGATITATDCAANCTGLGGIYLVYSGVFIPRAWDAFSSNGAATSGTGANNMNAGTISPTQTNDLIIAYCTRASTASAGTVETTPVAFTLANASTQQGTGEHVIYNSTTPFTPFVNGTNSVAYGCMSVAFK